MFKKIMSVMLSIIILSSCSNVKNENPEILIEIYEDEQPKIEWADFDLSSELLDYAIKKDFESGGEKEWIKLLAYAKSNNKNKEDIDYAASNINYIDFSKIKNSECFLRYVLNGYIRDNKLCVFFPIAENFNCYHYEDFGVKRDYGFRRKHLGNDIIADEGTPVICVEKGTVENVGWNEYGGWRLGIRSFDKRRYYYYAHLMKDHPYSRKFKKGDTVSEGEVIGYVGKTGYSKEENVNNINISHLHFGIQIMLDNDTNIWINPYSIVEFLERNKSEVKYDEKSKEFICN